MRMANNGFSLVEMIVVITIIGILVVIALPNYAGYVRDSNIRAVKNNLLAISAAQQNYYERYGIFCGDDGGASHDPNLTYPKAPCRTGIEDISSHLGLSLTQNSDTPIFYMCWIMYNPSRYRCESTYAVTDFLTYHPIAIGQRFQVKAFGPSGVIGGATAGVAVQCLNQTTQGGDGNWQVINCP